jgi:hypothetical protein
LASVRLSGSNRSAASRGARGSRRYRSGPSDLRAGKGGPDQFAIDRIENGGQHDRTPLFDRRNTNKRSFQTDFVGSLKWFHCSPGKTAAGRLGGALDRNITCQSEALMLGCVGSAFGGVLRGSGTLSVTDKSPSGAVMTSQCPEVVAVAIAATYRALSQSRPTARSRPSYWPVLLAFAHCPPFRRRSSPTLVCRLPRLVLSLPLTPSKARNYHLAHVVVKGYCPHWGALETRRSLSFFAQDENLPEDALSALSPRTYNRSFHARSSMPPTAGMELVWFADLGHHRWTTSNEERVASMQARQSDLGADDAASGRRPSPPHFRSCRQCRCSYSADYGNLNNKHPAVT